MTELIALCVPVCVVSTFFPGRTPSLKSSLPCLAVSQDSSHSSLIVRRMMDFVVAIRVRSDPGSACGPGSALAFGLWPAASLAARSAASLPGAPACAGIHRSWISHSWSRSLSSARIASTRIYCPDGLLGFRIAWITAWLSVKIVHLPGVFVVVCMSSAICSASTSPLSSAAYTVEVVDVPMYSVLFVRMFANWSLGAIAAAPTWPSIPLPWATIVMNTADYDAHEAC